MSAEQQFAIPKPRNSLKDETSDLLAARKEIALFSVKKAAIRVHEQKIHRIMKDPIKQEEEVNEKLRLFGRGYELVASEIADTSAVARGVLSPNEKYLATVGWSGECKIWQGLDSTPTVATRLIGHKFHAYDLDFHPHIASMDPESPCLATGGADCTVKLWTFDVTQPEQNFLEFAGHEDRVNRVKFHPMGLHVFSASYDKSVCMWDIEKEKKLHKFTGHTGGVHSLSMHPDGSLFASGDLNGVGMLWDIRTGSPVLPLQGHYKQILSMDFHSNGHILSSGSQDNSIKIWDLRFKGAIATIPSHLKLVSDLKFERGQSRFLLSAGYDGTVRAYSSVDWTQKMEVSCGQEKVSSVNILGDCSTIFATSIEKKLHILSLKTLPSQTAMDEET